MLVATLKLAVIPEDFSVAVVTFPTIRDAASAAAEVMRKAVPVAAMEIMDEVQMKVVNLGGATAPRVWKEAPTLFFKFSGTKNGVQENISLVQKITKANKGGSFEFAKDEREQKLLWSARKESLWSMLSLRKEGEEVCTSAHDPLPRAPVCRKHAPPAAYCSLPSVQRDMLTRLFREHRCGSAL